MFSALDLTRWGSVADWTLVVLTMIASTAAVWGVLYAAGNIRSQTENSRSEKIADSILDFERRYQEVARERLRVTVMFLEADAQAAAFPAADLLELKRFFDCFWSLQYSQWMFFRMGLVPREVYRDWVEARIAEFSSSRHSHVAGVNAIDGWRLYSRPTFVQFGRFSMFVDQVAELSTQFGHEHFIKSRNDKRRFDELDELLAKQYKEAVGLRGEARRELREARRRR